MFIKPVDMIESQKIHIFYTISTQHMKHYFLTSLVGAGVGDGLGGNVGWEDGDFVGALLGLDVGGEVGFIVSKSVGLLVGCVWMWIWKE